MMLSSTFLLAALVSITHGAPAQLNRTLEGRAPSTAKTVIAQMFEWTWDSIAAECTAYLGPTGYGFVQASPPQEHITGTQWWTDYQPVSYNLVSKRGNRAQFQNMINTCKTAGVQVIADTLWNHMAGSDSGTGTNGDSFTHYNYPAVPYVDANGDFHHCGLEPGDDIVNYDNQVEVQTCELDNLADLATETTHVRQTLAAYGNDLLSLGVAGMRLDAAKHMNVNDIAAIIGMLNSKPYITQEVIYGAGEPITPNQYTGNGDVQEFRYTSAIQSAFGGGGISSLENLDNLGWVPGTSANVFVANHDTERNGNSLNYNSPSNTYWLAMVFSLAHPFGTPTILSSYTYSTTDDGAPNGGAGTCSGTGGTNGWLCQHRWVGGMVKFRNNVGSAAITNWVAPSSQQIAFGRGSAGFVVVNNADSAWTGTFTTSLPAGTYCDVIQGPDSTAGHCTNATVVVSSSGTFTATIGGRNALAIHTGATTSASSTPTTTSATTPPTSTASVTVSFKVVATTTFGENIFIAGSIAQLGTWAPASAVSMNANAYPTWAASVVVPPNTAFQYKYIRKETDGTVNWEDDPNRSDTSPATGTQTLADTWQ